MMNGRFLFLLLIGLNLSCFSDETESMVNLKDHKLDDDRDHFSQMEIPYSDDYIVLVEKDKHLLSLCKQGNIIKSYPVNIRRESPDRLFEGDGQTPEGVFPIYQMAVVSDPPWSRWMAFNTVEKAKAIYIRENAAGEHILSEYERTKGVITSDEEIRRFNQSGAHPPLLRGFGIHGGGYNPNYDWTLGCPAMNDDDVIELYQYIQENPHGGIGTLVYIVDQRITQIESTY